MVTRQGNCVEDTQRHCLRFIKLSSLLNNKLPKFTIKVVETEDGLFKVVSSIPLENQISESKLKSKLEGVGVSEYSILNRSL